MSFKSIHIYDLLTLSWSTSDFGFPAPETRSGHVLILLQETFKATAVLVHGGITQGRQGTKVMSDLWSFSLETKAWTEIEIEKVDISKRYGHTAVQVDSNTL